MFLIESKMAQHNNSVKPKLSELLIGFAFKPGMNSYDDLSRKAIWADLANDTKNPKDFVTT